MYKRNFYSAFLAGLFFSSTVFAQSAVLPVPKDLKLPDAVSPDSSLLPQLGSPPPLPGLATPESLTQPADSAASAVPAAIPAAPENAQAPAKDAVVAVNTPKHKKKRKQATKQSASSLVPYRNIRMPATIYKTQYSKQNRHLPPATYESELDELLFVAIASDDVNMLRAMLDYSKRKINKADPYGNTPLIAAVKHNAVRSVYVLLGRHADTNAKDARGLTASQNARQLGLGHMARLIEMRSGNVHMADNSAVQTTYSPRSPLKLTAPGKPIPVTAQE